MKLSIHTDGGARGNPGPAATGYIIESDQGEVLHHSGSYLGETTNNVAEYSAVIEALEWVFSHYPNQPLSLDFFLDSNLVVQQLNRQFKIKQNHLFELAQKIWALLETPECTTTFSYVPRAQNAQADAEVNRVLDQQTL